MGSLKSLVLSSNFEEVKNLPFGSWFLIALFLALFMWAVFYFHKHGNKLHRKQIVILIIAGVLLVPVTYLGIKAPIYALDIKDVFSTPYFFIGFLQITLITLVLGFTGIAPAFLAGLLTGITQVLIQQQDPAMIAIYASVPIIIAKFLTTPQLQRPAWRGKNSWLVLIFTWLSLVPIILLSLGTRALFLRLPFGWHVLRYCLFIWLTLMPAFAIASIAFWVIQKWYPTEWRLEEFVKLPNTQNELKPAIEQIRLLSSGNYELELLNKPINPREKALYQALENLRKNLQFRHEAQSRLLSLDPSHYSKEGYDLILSSVLRAALTRDASSARLLLLDEESDESAPNIRSRFGQGENTRLYAYLDATILDKIGNQEQLILTDIKVDHYFGLSSASPFPQSIIALPLSDKGRKHGILWVGFEQMKWFSAEDIKFYQELAFRASVAMSTKQETQELMSNKNAFEATLNAIPHAIFILDNDQQIGFINESAKTLARNSDDLMSSKLGNRQFIHPIFDELLNDTGKQQFHENSLELANGAKYDLELYPLLAEEKREGTVILLVDKAWLTQINQQRTEFISNFSHDLQSPLKIIKGHLKLLERMGNLNKEQQTYVKLIEENTESMTRLVNRMLSLEQLDAEEALNYTRFDFQQKTDEVMRLLMPSAQQKKLSISTDYSKMPTPFISADQTYIQQAMYNLIENAIKYSPIGGQVSIRAEKDASWLRISVVDEGKGIAPLDQPSLFNRFHHLNEDENFENKVQGLGLAIVKSIADKHGGSVRVESQLGEGSKFYLDIPVHKL